MKLLGMLFSPSSCPISHVPALFQPFLDNSTLSRPLSTHVSLFPAAFLSRTSICVFHMAAMLPTETFHKGTLIGLTALIFVMVVINVDGVRNVSELQLLISLLFILRMIYEYGDPRRNINRGKLKHSNICPSATIFVITSRG
jgi:hypothetical protein